MADDKLVSDFSYPAAPGDYFPPILGDPGDELPDTSDLAAGMRRTGVCAVQRLLSDQVITNNTNTLISFDNLVETRGSDFWDSGSPTIVNVPVGLWIVWAQVRFAANATGYRFAEIAASDFAPRSRIAASPTLQTEITLSGLLIVEGPDEEADGLRVRHTAGADLNVEFAEFRIERLTKVLNP